jgi:hypothetical protein
MRFSLSIGWMLLAELGGSDCLSRATGSAATRLQMAGQGAATSGGHFRPLTANSRAIHTEPASARNSDI